MAIKSGELIHVGNQVLVDRAQTAGPGSLNIPQEKIYELGNYRTVGTVLDTPDLKFSLDSYDASAQMEALLLGLDFASMSTGTEMDMTNVLSMDVASQFKKGRTADTPFEVEGSVVIPFLTPDTITYDFGLKSDAKQSVSLSGDSLYWSNGSAYIEEVVGSALTGSPQTYTLVNAAIPYEGDTTNGVRYALSITNLTTQIRLLVGVDYTEAATGGGLAKAVTITFLDTIPADTELRISYQSDTKASYPQASNTPASAVKPAALRGRDIEVRVAGTTITDRWSSVQSFQCTWSVTINKDEEFGNPNVYSQDFDYPDVKGTVEIKPRDINELLTRVQQIAGVTDASVVGALSSVAIPLEVILHSPVDGSVLKTLYVPDARFSLPGFQGQVNQKLTVKFDFDSDTGALFVYKGDRSTLALTSATPNTLAHGSTADIVLAGTGFQPSAAVTISGTGLTVNSVTVTSSTQITANVTASSGATASARNITVTNVDLTTVTATAALTIT